ncbi:MAG: type II secretion system protein [Acidobacteria bacterium]|nr:type II secretion system protein [Acidobacteriota bacterium]
MSLRTARRQGGFSLPELLVVLSIIMLLATLAIPRVRRAKEKAEEASAVVTMNAVTTSQEAHRITHGEYASNFKVLVGERGVNIVQDTPSDSGDEPSAPTGKVMVQHGYIFRLNRTATDEYTVTAEPVENRSTRPFYSMNQTGDVKATTGGGPEGGGVAEPTDGSPPPGS